MTNYTLNKYKLYNPPSNKAIRYGEAEHPGPRGSKIIENLKDECEDIAINTVLHKLDIPLKSYINRNVEDLEYIDELIEIEAEKLFDERLEIFDKKQEKEIQLREECENEALKIVLESIGMDINDYFDENYYDPLYPFLKINNMVLEVVEELFKVRLLEMNRLDWFADSVWFQKISSLIKDARKRVFLRRMTVFTGSLDKKSSLNRIPLILISFILSYL